MDQNVTLKIIIVGDQGVGKTSLLKRYIDNKFSINEKATIGADFMTKRLIIQKYVVQLQIWDTAGLERFNTLNRAYYRGADAVIVVYDVTVLDSYNDLLYWKDQILEHNDGFELSKFTVIGNKIDQKDAFVGKNSQVEKMRENGVKFFKGSARTGQNVKEIFDKVSKQALENYLRDNTYDREIREVFQDEVRSKVFIPEEETQEEESWCCN